MIFVTLSCGCSQENLLTLGIGALVACRNKAKHGMALVMSVSGPEPAFHVGQWVKIVRNFERYSYAGVSLGHAVGKIIAVSEKIGELVQVQFGGPVVYVDTGDIDPSEDPIALKRRDTREQELRATIFRLRIALGEAWPYIHEHCTIQTLRDRVLKELRERP